MWFKQMTCDKCLRLLENVGRHNYYFIVRFTDYKIMPFNIKYPEDYNYYKKHFPIAFVSSTSLKPNGNIFMYSIVQEDFRLENKAYFCSNQCACEFTKQNSCLMLYYDEGLQSVKSITPHIEQINRELGFVDLKGLPFNWKKEWIIPKNSFTDLKMYNSNITFPKLNPPYNLTFYKNEDESDYLNLLLDKSFQYSFYGSNNFPEEQTTDIKGHVKSFEFNFSRRLGIEWIIRENEKFVGFVRMSCIHPNDPYNWYIEFGLIQSMRGKGIMGNILKNILIWCKRNGLDKVYATSESHNIACDKLMQRIPYQIQTNKIPAADKYAGSRYINRYIINLQEQNQRPKPIIIKFEVSKTNIIESDFIDVFWETKYTNLCKIVINNGYKILEYANLESYGKKRFKISEFKDSVKILIIAFGVSNENAISEFSVYRKSFSIQPKESTTFLSRCWIGMGLGFLFALLSILLISIVFFFWKIELPKEFVLCLFVIGFIVGLIKTNIPNHTN